jgi:5'-nucleotidase
MTQPLILLVNDDGVESPGLAALAAALDPLGELLIVAPQVQQSGMGRSFPSYYDGRIVETTIRHNGQSWKAYAASASPAQCVQHAVLELADRPLALAVSGINYGENVGTGVTGSGTVGAAMEAASHGVPALAISLEVDFSLHYSHTDQVDFEASIHFSRLFAQRWLTIQRPAGVDLIKVDIPAHATTETPWRMARLERGPFFVHIAPLRTSLDQPGRVGYTSNPNMVYEENSDAALVKAGFVAVTPLTLDMTAPIPPEEMRQMLDGHGS